jgi:hypothetical protein
MLKNFIQIKKKSCVIFLKGEKLLISQAIPIIADVLNEGPVTQKVNIAYRTSVCQRMKNITHTMENADIH